MYILYCIWIPVILSLFGYITLDLLLFHLYFTKLWKDSSDLILSDIIESCGICLKHWPQKRHECGTNDEQ